MTTGVFFLLLAALVVVFFAICIWSYHTSQHEERLERIIQMQQLTLSCRDNSISWANTLLSDWVTQLVLIMKSNPSRATEPGGEAKTEPVEPKDEIDTTEPIAEVKPEVADSVEESA